MGLWSQVLAKLHLFGARSGLRGRLLTCREIIDFLEAYRTKELPPEQRREFEIHMNLCPPCVNYLDSYEKTLKLEKRCKDDDKTSVPQELIDAILAARKKSS